MKTKDTDSLDHVGENIRAFRRRLHMTQTEMARRLGMRPAPVNCIEKGRNLPSARVLNRLSEILGVPIDAFFSTTPSRYLGARPPVSLSDPVTVPEGSTAGHAFAVAARTSEERARLPEALLTTAEPLADAFLALEDLSGAPRSAQLPLQLPFEWTEVGLTGLVDRVRRLLGVNDAVIFDVVELLENAGLRLIFAPLADGWESISFHDEKNGNAFIFIASGAAMNAERQLFRVSYELGRLYAHVPGQGDGSAIPGRDRRGKRFEPDRLSRRFAALFLMPEAAVRATVAQTGVTPDGWSIALLYRLKHRFGVSAEAFLYRLSELDLITPILGAQIQRAIHDYYQAHGNREPDATRRVLSPNGRIGDLLHVAADRWPADSELARVRKMLKALQLPGLDEADIGSELIGA